MILKNSEQIKKKLQEAINRFGKLPIPDEVINQQDIFKREIIESLERGVSPVEGEGRFVDYSDSYKNQIGGTFKLSSGAKVKSKFTYTSLSLAFNKAVRPVNLKLSGDMYKSIRSLSTKNGFIIEFTSKLAYIHDTLGAGKKKVIRRILPRGDERYSRSLMSGLSQSVKDYLNRITKLN